MKLLILTLTLSSALFAGVYDYGYHPSKDVVSSEQKNALFYGDFERILRYDPIPYSPSDPVKLEETPYMSKMYESIQSYVSSGVPYKVSIVGHTRLNEESEHESAQKSTFFGSIQNSLFESKSDAKENRAACERAVAAVKKQLMDNKVKEDNIVAECRDGANPHYLENEGDAREMNNRVLVTLYTAKVEKKGQPVPVPAVPLAVVSKPAAVVLAKPVAVAAGMDSDRDGVVDSQDKCPNTPKGYVVDENGCPVAVTLHINFATSKYAIPASASKEIEKLKGFMKEYQGYRIEISGHTDSMGKSDKNQRLSENRAKALAKVLVKGGVAADRIKTQGFGETQPIASNIKAVGRAQNRRVEVKMFETPKNN